MEIAFGKKPGSRKEWTLKEGLFTYTKGVEVTIQRRENSG
jgi:hypothetical protein